MTIQEGFLMLGTENSGGMEVKPEEIQELLEFFSKNTYKAKDSHPKVKSIMKKCLGLFALDYNFSVLPNAGGELSTNYPSSLVILESEKSPASSPSLSKSYNGRKSVHFVDNGVGSCSAYLSQSANGGRLSSPSPLNFSKTDEENGEDDREKISFTAGIDENGKAERSGCTMTSSQDPDLNSVFIDTSERQPYGEEQSSMNSSGFTSEEESPVSLDRSGITCSTNSEFNSGIENGTEVAKLKELCSRARLARCRARFPIPVILYNKKNICRSATLSGGPEIYGRSSFDYLFSGGVDWKQYYDEEEEIIVPETQSDWQLFDRVRSQDIRLLKAFQVQTIVDLMVEKKKVKFGVNVTSSEKVDKENRYSEFTIVSLPYPGCEFFKKYRDNGYNGEDLIFEWNQTHVDANIFVPPDPITTSLSTDWAAYRKWDLIALTQNYLKLLLAYLRDSEDGLLIHCISGWDRTPLFVSLLRLSLWADGVIHKSLCAEQILFLTLAYDWLLFGHNLEDRLSKGEEILFFCFYFLKYIVQCEYNVDGGKEMVKTHHNIRTRNDSDVQLDGVLLEGGSLTSPDGSSWSLSSCSSSSSKSMDNPPVYFNVESESWDESLGAHHLKGNKVGKGVILDTSFAHDLIDEDDETDCGSTKKTFCLDSSIQEVFSCPLVADGFNGNSTPSPLPRPNSNQCSPAVGVRIGTSQNTSSGFSAQNGNGKTSPVAVPRSSRTSHRHESSSSASIGSWQFITGTGSLRETISSSDPGSSHSHPSRLSLSSALECIETSESSCTLVEELTPVEFPERHPLSSFEDKIEIPLNGAGRNGGFENELDNSLVLKNTQSSTASVSEKKMEPTPTGSLHRPNFMSMRRERLQTVRAHFYSLYSTAIGFQFKSVNDNGSGGLGSLIGNFATKVGIRSAHRHMS